MSLAEVTQLLAATLNPDGNTRISAELKLAEYMSSSGVFISGFNILY
jgi:hypothetical protein